MDELISRKAAIEEAKEWIEAVYCDHDEIRERMAIKHVINGIKELPPAYPQIIRCKDCKHWIPYDWMFNEVWQSKNIADYSEDDIGCDCSEMAMKANDFCSRAERRTE